MKTLTTVFISGNFNIVHAGHVRLFSFAKNLGDKLIVGVNSDSVGGSSIYIEENLRLEAVKSNNLVDHVILVNDGIEKTLMKLKPDIIVKGKEFEHVLNTEAAVAESFGGRLVFGSSQVSLSSLEMINRELASPNNPISPLPSPYLKRHNIDLNDIQNTINKFKQLKVCVIGDLIVDEYVTCEALGMSQEDPTLVVTPIDKRRFVGGAGIVASHAAALGARATLLTVTGKDKQAEFANETLDEYDVSLKCVVDESRPTTLKQRYRAEGKTLLRVSHLHQHSISVFLQNKIFRLFKECLADCDLLVFSDFNYGCLPQALIEKCTMEAHAQQVVTVADSQSSSQVGDISRFKGISMLSATEREVRVALKDNDAGLAVLAEKLRANTKAQCIMIKLAADGVLIHAESDVRGVYTDLLPALNLKPVDVAGAGDSMLIASGLSLATGSSPWISAAIGSSASALQIGRLGNQPLDQAGLLQAILSNIPGI